MKRVVAALLLGALSACCKQVTSGGQGHDAGRSAFDGGSTGGSSGGTGGGSTTGGTGGIPDGGSPYGQHATPVTPASLDGGGGAGVQNLPDGGGVVLGKVANFHSHFAYLSNSGQALGSSFVARVDTDTGQEIARYPTVIPLDNNYQPSHPGGVGNLLCTPGQPTTCLVDVTDTYYDNAPSRTVVDLNGGVFVANRGQCDWAACAPGSGKFVNSQLLGGNANHQVVQGSVTYIANRVDHPEQCAPRCLSRKGWAVPGAPAPFSSGIALPLPDGGTLSIPSSEALLPAAGQALAPDVWAHPCLDNGPHDPSDVTDPTNYDDCVRFTIPVGAPNGTDLKVAAAANLSQDHFAPRGLAISKTCGSFGGSGQACDLYVGLTEPGPETGYILHLDHTTNFGVKAVIDSRLPNYGLYGAAIDCQGIFWGGTNAAPAHVALDTSDDEIVSRWQYADATGKTQVVDTVQDFDGKCGDYGIAADLNQRIWSGSNGLGKVAPCAFDYRAFQGQTQLQVGAPNPLPQAQAQALLNSDWTVFDFSSDFPHTVVGGIVADENGLVYGAVSVGGSPAAVAFDFAGSGTACGTGGDSHCLWATQNLTGAGYGVGSWGIDLDQDGNPWLSQRSGPSSVLGLSAAAGQPLPPFASASTSLMGPNNPNDLYTYSDFTGYALRHITQPAGAYQQIFSGCPAPLKTQWQGLAYGANVPAGTELAFEVDVADDPAAFSGTSGAQILGTWNCAAAASCPSVASLASANLPEAKYARVTAKLSGPTCTVSGVTPTLQWLQLDYNCPVPPFH